MNTLTNLRTLRDFLSQFRFNFTSEAELQLGIEQALTASQFRMQREVRLSAKDRLDFLIDDEIAIETKIGGSSADVLRQIARYAQSDQVKAILVVTSRASHYFPSSFNGKPVLAHSLLEGAF